MSRRRLAVRADAETRATADRRGARTCTIGFPGINSLGNPNGLPFNPSIYLSSTEVNGSSVWAIDFSTGQEIVIPKSTAARVRCIRKPFGLKF